jgi:hypothetical protein
LDAERVGPVSIEQLRRAHATFPHERLYARQSEFQFYRFGRNRNEEAGLCGLRLHRVDPHPQVHDRAGRRMGFQIELQEFEERLGIQRGDRQPQTTFVRTAGFQFEA